MTDRLVGDSRPSTLYTKPFRDERHAQGVAEIVFDHCSVFDGQARPDVEFTGLVTNRRFGTCEKDGHIRLNIKGENWGTLAHEMCHMVARGMHGAEFRQAHAEVVEFMEFMAQ